MPISSTNFETHKCAEDLLSNTMRASISITEYMIREQGLPKIDVTTSRKHGAYHKTRSGKHNILYGAGCFLPKNARNFRTFVISDNRVCLISATRVTPDIHIMSVIIEETAHYVQVLHHGRHYGSVHNAAFAHEFKILWDKFSDIILPMVQEALDLDSIPYRSNLP